MSNKNNINAKNVNTRNFNYHTLSRDGVRGGMEWVAIQQREWGAEGGKNVKMGLMSGYNPKGTQEGVLYVNNEDGADTSGNFLVFVDNSGIGYPIAGGGGVGYWTTSIPGGGGETIGGDRNIIRQRTDLSSVIIYNSKIDNPFPNQANFWNSPQYTDSSNNIVSLDGALIVMDKIQLLEASGNTPASGGLGSIRYMYDPSGSSFSGRIWDASASSTRWIKFGTGQTTHTEYWGTHLIAQAPDGPSAPPADPQIITTDQSAQSKGTALEIFPADCCGNYSMALGFDCSSGPYSLALGSRCDTTSTTGGEEYGGALAIGLNNTASGKCAVAMGFDCSAGGIASFAGGSGCIAAGGYSMAMGYQTTASSGYSIAMGYQTTASGFGSTAMGHSNTASGYTSVAMGGTNTAGGESSVAMGFTNTTGADAAYSVAMGYDCSAGGIASFADGSGCIARGDYSVALGYGADTSNNYQFVVGISNESFGGNTFLIDNSQNVAMCVGGDLSFDASRCRAGIPVLDVSGDVRVRGIVDPLGLGLVNVATVVDASAIYLSMDGSANAQMLFSVVTDASKLYHMYTEGGVAVSAPIGGGAGVAFWTQDTTAAQGTVLEPMDASGIMLKRTLIYGTDASGLMVGDGNTASGDYAVAMGYDCSAGGNASFADGSGCWALGDYAVAMGVDCSAGGVASFAMGVETTASGYGSTAMGQDTTASGDYSTAMGILTTASGDYSTAMGYDCSAGGVASFADGSGCIARGDYSVALGYGADTSNNYQFVLGISNESMAGNTFLIDNSQNVAMCVGGDLGFDASRCRAGIPVLDVSGDVRVRGIVDPLGLGLVNVATVADASAIYLSMDGSANAQMLFSVVTDASKLYHMYTEGGVALSAPIGGGVGQGFWTQDTTAAQGTVLEPMDASGIMLKRTLIYGTDASGLMVGDGNTAIGDYSVAMGYDCSAGGVASFADGSGCIARGDYSVALGYGADTSNNYQFVLGISNESMAGNTFLIDNSQNVAMCVGGDLGFDASRCRAGIPVLDVSGDVRVRGIVDPLGLGLVNVATVADASAIYLSMDGSANAQMLFSVVTDASKLYHMYTEGGVALSAPIGGGVGQGFWTQDTTAAQGTVLEPMDASGIMLKRTLIYGTDASGLMVGDDNTASGDYAVAMGEDCLAGGDYSTAMGLRALATGSYSTAMGIDAKALGYSSTVMGNYTRARGDYSTAMGQNTDASGNYSTAMGSLTRARGAYSVAMGYDCSAGGVASFADGSGCIAAGDYSVAMGYFTTASGTASTAMGDSTMATNSYSTAMGVDTTASGEASTAMGDNTTASGDFSTAMGYITDASGDYSTAMGYDCSAVGIASFADGSGCIATGDYSVAMGHYTRTDGSSCIAMGYNTTAGPGRCATAMGNGSQATGLDSVAMGLDTKSTGAVSTAMGYFTTASGGASTTMGYFSRASGYASVAMGDHTTAGPGNYSTAMGFDCSAVGIASFADGSGCNAFDECCVALGCGADASGTCGFMYKDICGNEFCFDSGGSSSSGGLVINGAAKAFVIPHPEYEGKMLRHACIEAPTRGTNMYEYQLEATEPNQTTKIALPSYFKHINGRPRVYVTPKNVLSTCCGDVDEELIYAIILTEKPGIFNVMVTGVRKDPGAVKYAPSIYIDEPIAPEDIPPTQTVVGCGSNYNKNKLN